MRADTYKELTIQLKSTRRLRVLFLFPILKGD